MEVAVARAAEKSGGGDGGLGDGVRLVGTAYVWSNSPAQAALRRRMDMRKRQRGSNAANVSAVDEGLAARHWVQPSAANRAKHQPNLLAGLPPRKGRLSVL